MLIETSHQIKLPLIVSLSLIVIISVVFTAPLPVATAETRKLDETAAPATPSGGEKCTPCGNSSPPPSPPYYPSPPPPPPYYPPPPPPYEYSSPPPPKKNPPSQYCPPPPASIMYITGPPGNLYPVDENFNRASRQSFAAALPLLAGLLTVLALR
ncbi:leucine-rich repeat extensin-like protein 6 [Neltuma alba]|uniref:leucine-rich repeat extensin-like protein 6 n=1 Tax=Neltuma alba TaxID=207710 RepID=UPI0010A46C2C|nr:leucine-rich repeat extensin-like protein 6 [Prosopis alba]